MKKKTCLNQGLTMIEVLVVAAIIGLLILLLIFLMRNQQSRAQDARRKADLESIKIAFEDYFNDKGCYPPSNYLNNCGSDTLAPYLRAIPCDPVTKEPYVYEPIANCAGYKVYTALEDATDPIISVLRCDGINGCGSSAGIEYNYGIYAGGSLFGPNYVAPPSSPDPKTVYVYACDPTGNCNEYAFGNPALVGCPVTFDERTCDNKCSDPSKRCPSSR